MDLGGPNLDFKQKTTTFLPNKLLAARTKKIIKYGKK